MSPPEVRQLLKEIQQMRDIVKKKPALYGIPMNLFERAIAAVEDLVATEVHLEDQEYL